MEDRIVAHPFAEDRNQDAPAGVGNTSGSEIGSTCNAPILSPAGLALMHQVVANGPVIVFALDRNGRFLLSEGRDLALLGLEAGEVVGRSAYEMYQDYPEILKEIGQALVGESGMRTQLVQGRQFALWCGPLTREGGDVEGILGIAWDVTEKKRAEHELLVERQLLRNALARQERDRRLIGYEIHDGLVQDATGALMRLEAVMALDTISEGVRENLTTVRDLMRRSVTEARHLIEGMRPRVLEERGIVAAIEHWIKGFPAEAPAVEFLSDIQSDRIGLALETAVFRIVQEALYNVRRHSGSDRAEVRLTQRGETIHLTVQDWGRGFDVNEVGDRRFGLEGIRERARLHEGQAEIRSAPGEGTRVLVDLPLGVSTEYYHSSQ